jgi:hypothetical protein
MAGPLLIPRRRRGYSSRINERLRSRLLLTAARRQRLADGLRLRFQVPQVSFELAAPFLFAEETALESRSITAAAAARAALLPACATAAVMSAALMTATATAAAVMAATIAAAALMAAAATTATAAAAAVMSASTVVAVMATAVAASPLALASVHNVLLLLGFVRQLFSVGVAHAGRVSFAVLA